MSAQGQAVEATAGGKARTELPPPEYYCRVKDTMRGHPTALNPRDKERVFHAWKLIDRKFPTNKTEMAVMKFLTFAWGKDDLDSAWSAWCEHRDELARDIALDAI